MSAVSHRMHVSPLCLTPAKPPAITPADRIAGAHSEVNSLQDALNRGEWPISDMRMRDANAGRERPSRLTTGRSQKTETAEEDVSHENEQRDEERRVRRTCPETRGDNTFTAWWEIE